MPGAPNKSRPVVIPKTTARGADGTAAAQAAQATAKADALAEALQAARAAQRAAETAAARPPPRSATPGRPRPPAAAREQAAAT